MAVKPFLVDVSLYDLDCPTGTIEEIRRFNHQRFEMEQLTAVVYENTADGTCVGYKDISENEFWVRGHFPERPLMPGVVICETAAQLASFFVTKHCLFGEAVMGFAGLEEVKFRGMVKPGDRLVVQVKLIKVRRILVTADFMAIVGNNIVCEGVIKGFPLPSE